MEEKLKNIVDVGDIVDISGFGIGVVYCIGMRLRSANSQLATIWWFRPGAFTDPGRKSTEHIRECNILSKCNN